MLINENENRKYKLNINEIYNDVVDIIELLENTDAEKFQEYFINYNKSNSFIIKRYYENDVVEFIKNNYDVDIELIHDSYKINNKNFFNTEIIVIDPIFKTIPIKKEKLIEIFHNKINDVDKIFNCYIKNIIDIIEINIEYIYKLNNINYINHYSIENKINTYDILKLFDYIVDDIQEYNNNINNDDDVDDAEKIDVDELILLFKYVIDELNHLSNLNKYYHYFNSNRKFKINLNNSLTYLCCNNKFNIYYNDDIIYHLLYDDLYEFVDPELLYYLNFKFEINDEINNCLFQEILYMNNMNDDYEFNYVVELDENNDYKNYYIEISIDDIIELNENINNINDLLFDPFKIDDIFENYNNNYDDELFIYLIFENDYEILFNDELFHHKYYYELNNIKFYNVYDLRNYILNYLSTLNLNCYFKFDDDIYIN